MRAALLLLPLALAACGSNNPRYAQCEAQVDADPEVRQLTLRYAGASSADQMMQFDPRPVRQDKMKACLHGYPTTGGVEPIRKPRYTLDLF
jgi:hypothetical protein